MSKIREQITKELLIKQAKALKVSKGDTEKAAKACNVSYAGYLNRFRVSGLNFHEVRRQVLDGASPENAIKGAKLHESSKPSMVEEALRSIVRDEFRRLRVAA